jgi:hypothetical protein
VLLEDTDLTFHTDATPKSTYEDSIMVQVDFGTESSQLQGRLIWTSFAGLGADQNEAIKNGFMKFLLCPFHVLLGALAGHVCDEGSEEWRTVTGQIEWDVCDSPLLTQGIDDPRVVPFEPLIEPLIRAFLKTADPIVHWGDVFFGFLNGKQIALEVTLDGSPWADGTEALANWDWRPGDGYASGRYFFMALPKSRAAAEQV